MLQNIRIKMFINLKFINIFKQKKGTLTCVRSLFSSKKGDAPIWSYVVAIVLGLIVLMFLMWLAVKSVSTGVELLP